MGAGDPIAACEVAGEALCPLVRLTGRSVLSRRADATRRAYAEEAESGEDCAILSLDPGGTTGWAVLVIRPEALLESDTKILTNVTLYTCGQIGEGTVVNNAAAEHEQVHAIADMIDSWPHAAVVREDFILRTANKSRDTLSPVRIGFGIDHLLWLRGRVSHTQQPAMAKGTATDERLRSWGLYRPGQEHARDATRHAIVFARRLKASEPLLRLSFPWLFG